MRTLVSSVGGTTRSVTVSDPLGRPVEADFGLIENGSTAIVENAFRISFSECALNAWYVLGKTPASCVLSRSIARMASSTA